MIGIILIAFGTGGIKPCVGALGADQFKVTRGLVLDILRYFFQIPEQTEQIASYFAMFYASINFGSLFSTIITPYLR